MNRSRALHAMYVRLLGDSFPAVSDTILFYSQLVLYSDLWSGWMIVLL